MRLFKTLISTLVSCLFLASCATSQPTTSSKIPNWQEIVATSPVFRQNHTGFALYDLEKQEMVAEYQSDRYFTPASNTKLFTLYAGLCMLDDSIPALRYVTKGDSLIFWGTGDPNLLHPDMPPSKVLDVLKNWRGKLFYYPHNYLGRRFGAGWSWSEYAEYYQCELSALPLYGNIVRFTNKMVHPRIFKDSLRTSGWSEEFRLSRDETHNTFFSSGWPSKSFSEDIPYHISPQLTAQLLTDTLKKEVNIFSKKTSWPNYSTLYSSPVDTVYRRMLQLSDNMIAEQIMLLVASQIDTNNIGFDTEKGIEYIKKQFLTDLPDEPIWKDGSGLSRYNLFTPRSIVKLLQKIYVKVPQQERLFGLMSVGGKAGTIRSQYKSQVPFVFAKSGSLGNNYSLSGYLRTKKGKVLLFSLMNTGFTRSSSEIRREVERVLTEIYEKY